MRILAIALLLFALNASAQFSRSVAFRGAAVARASGGGGGGGGSYTLIDHQTGNATSTGTASVTLNTSGANFVAVVCCNYNSSGADTGPSSSTAPDDVYTGLNRIGAGSATVGTNQIFYCTAPTQTGSYTITAKRNYTVLVAYSFSYSGGTPSLDTQASGAGSSSFTTLQPGSATPAGANELFISGITWTSGASVSINSSFSTVDTAQAGTAGLFGAAAYKTSSSAENPTWTVTAGNIGGATMAVFK